MAIELAQQTKWRIRVGLFGKLILQRGYYHEADDYYHHAGWHFIDAKESDLFDYYSYRQSIKE